MHKLQRYTLFFISILLILLGCESPKQQTSSILLQYTKLNRENAADKKFFLALKNSLKDLGSLVEVCANTIQLNAYRNDHSRYPTNYYYTLQANPTATLEAIQQADQSIISKF